MFKKLLLAACALAVAVAVYRFWPAPSVEAVAEETPRPGPAIVQVPDSEVPGLQPYSPSADAPALDPHALLDNGRTVLTDAAFRGDRSVLKSLVQADPGLNLSHPDGNGDNVVVAAVAGGNRDLANSLMSAGAMADPAAFERFSRGLDPAKDRDTIWWMLIHDMPFADPQILGAAYNPGAGDEIGAVLAAGYRPSREEAWRMMGEGLSRQGYGPLYALYPDLFSAKDVRAAFNPINYASATARERRMMEAMFPTVPYEDSRAFEDLVDKLPYEVARTHPDFDRFGPAHFAYYCDSDDESVVLLLDAGAPCKHDEPFINALRAGNYALVQRYIDTGLDPATYRAWGKSAMGNALEYNSAESLEMAKLLMDNGAATAQERAAFYRAIDAFGSRFDHYRDYPRTPLRLLASAQDTLTVLAYHGDEKRYHLTRQGAEGTLLWDHVFEGERFFNVLDNPVGLYALDGGVLVVYNRYLDGRRKVRLTRFDERGQVVAQQDVLGHFESLVLSEAGIALTTCRSSALFDVHLEAKGDILSAPQAFRPAVSMVSAEDHAHHRRFFHDLRKQDDYPDRKLLLYRTNMAISSWEPKRPLSQYLALVLSKDGETSVTAQLGGGDITPLDFALSEHHAYVIESTPDEVVIQKRSADFRIPSYHYLAFDAHSPFSTGVDSLSCDNAGCTAVGTGDGRLALVRTVPGERQQRLTRTRFDAHLGDEDDEAHWQVVRLGGRDFVSGDHQILFDDTQPVATGDAILMDRSEGLLAAPTGHLYAFGNHDGNAAYEELDAEGTLVGHHEFDFGYAESRVSAMHRLPDGRLLVVGRIFQYFHFFRTFAVLLEADGTPVWRRVYAMKTTHGLLVDAAAGAFETIDGSDDAGHIVRFSLADGSELKRLPGAEGLQGLYRGADGITVGLGRVEHSYGSGQSDKVKQPLLYCRSADDAQVSATLVGAPGDRIDAVAPWGDALVAAYALNNDGSAHTNVVLARIDPQHCRVIFDWEP